MKDIKFLEIEHKYLVEESFDREHFLAQVAGLGPIHTSYVDVTDRYYVTHACPNHVYRHRYDAEIQQLTVKGLSDDPEARLEVNLDLGLQKGNQADRVSAFLTPLGPYWWGDIAKQVWVFYFPKAEIVFYEASHRSRRVRCIEIEAVQPQTLEEGKNIIGIYEEALGLCPQTRCLKSLFHLLLSENLPSKSKASLTKTQVESNR